MLNSQNRVFNPYFNRYLPNENNAFTDNSIVEPTIFDGKLSFSLKHFSGHYYGQSFIKIVRDPLIFEPLSRDMRFPTSDKYRLRPSCAVSFFLSFETPNAVQSA